MDVARVTSDRIVLAAADHLAGSGPGEIVLGVDKQGDRRLHRAGRTL